MSTPDILQRELTGEVIALTGPEFHKIAALITEAPQIIVEMNTGYHDPVAMHALFSHLTRVAVDESIGDDMLIGPKVNPVIINHPIHPARRRSTSCAPIVIKKGAWLAK